MDVVILVLYYSSLNVPFEISPINPKISNIKLYYLV